MYPADSREQGYVVPIYRAPADACWYHFLHGNVPGHQIDFIYRADVPQGALTQQHFSHLARVIKYIEPRAGAPFAFAIGNLSRDDTQHEPGHGGVALILGHRIKGATDHAGRRDPPFAHGIAAVDRDMDGESLFAAAMAFCRHMLGEPSAEDPRSLAPMYTRFTAAGPSERVGVVEGYLAGFDDLPRIERSQLSKKWLSQGRLPVKRILIGHAEDAPFEALARVAARIAAMLYQSDIRWTSITTGRDPEIANGVSIRLVPRREAVASDADTRALQIEQVPEEEAEIAAQLFGAVESDRPRWAIPLGEWRSSARRAPSEPLAPQLMSLMSEAATAEVRAPASDGADAAGSMGEAVALVRSSLPLSAERAEEPIDESLDVHAIASTREAVPSTDVAPAQGRPLPKDAALKVNSADGDSPPVETTAGAQVKAACEDRARRECTVALATSQGSREEGFEDAALSTEPRLRRRSRWLGVLAAGAAGFLVVLVLLGRVAMSEDKAVAVEDSRRDLVGSAAFTFAKFVRSAAVLESKRVADGRAKEGGAMALLPVQMAQQSKNPAAAKGSKAPGSQQQASKRGRQTNRPLSEEQPASDDADPPFNFN